MRRLLLVGILVLTAMSTKAALAGDVWGSWPDGLPGAWVTGPACDPYVDYNCTAPKVSPKLLKATQYGACDPYVNYKCLDTYLGDDFGTRLYRYYQLEWGKGVAPADPKAPPGRRSDAEWP